MKKVKKKYGDGGKTKLQSGVVVDKNTNMAKIYENFNPVDSFPVITGKYPYKEVPNYYDFEHEETATRNTPSGTYVLTPGEMYRYKGYNLNNPERAKNVWIHTTYDPVNRAPSYNMKDPRARDLSYGCINCRNEDIDKLYQHFPQGDTLIVNGMKPKPVPPKPNYNQNFRVEGNQITGKYKMGGMVKGKKKYSKKAAEGITMLSENTGTQSLWNTPKPILDNSGITDQQIATGMNTAIPSAYDQYYMNKPSSNLAPVSPDVLNPYETQQGPQNRIQFGALNSGNGIKTTDIIGGGLQLANGLIPNQKPKSNKNYLQQGYNTNPYGTGSQATYKKGGKIKADAGMQLTPQLRDNYENAMGWLQQNKYDVNNPNLRHDPSIGMGYLNDYNKANPDKQFDTQYLPAMQQYFQDNKDQSFVRNTDPNKRGFSTVDNYPADQTLNSRQTTYRHQQTNPQGQVYYTENLGTTNFTPEQSQQFTQRAHNSLQPQQPQVYPTTLTAQTTVPETQQPNPFIKQKQTAKTQKSNYFIQGKKGQSDYSIDSTRMAYGGTIPFADGGNVQVDNNKFEMISPNTAKLKGAYHTNGGTDIRSGNNEVEAEKGETLHIDNEGNTIVGGNLYLPGTKMKYKEAFTKLGKQEAKTEKIKDKATHFLTNFDPNDKYQGLAFNTGKVLSDGYEQDKMKNDSMKQYLTDSQNFQLELAEKTGKSPKEITRVLSKAKYGKKMKAGGDPEERMYSVPQLNPSFNTETNDLLSGIAPQPNTDIGTGIYGTDIWGNDMITTANNLAKNYTPATMSNPLFNNPNAHSDNYLESPIPKTNFWNEDVNDPNSTKWLGQNSQGYFEQNPLKRTQSPSTAHIKGMRNKFRPLDYLGEISTLFEKPEPVQNQQINPILESKYNLSLQNKKNAILSAYNPALKAQSNNSAIQAGIAGQLAEQLGNVDAEELQLNQQNRGAIDARNLQELRGVRDTNLKLAMDQMEKQTAAKAITQDNKFRAATSISAKEAQRRAQNTNLNLMEHAAGWVYNPQSGKYEMLHPGYVFDRAGLRPFDLDKESYQKKKYKNKSGNSESTTEVTEKPAKYGKSIPYINNYKKPKKSKQMC